VIPAVGGLERQLAGANGLARESSAAALKTCGPQRGWRSGRRGWLGSGCELGDDVVHRHSRQAVSRSFSCLLRCRQRRGFLFPLTDSEPSLECVPAVTTGEPRITDRRHSHFRAETVSEVNPLTFKRLSWAHRNVVAHARASAAACIIHRQPVIPPA